MRPQQGAGADVWDIMWGYKKKEPRQGLPVAAP